MAASAIMTPGMSNGSGEIRALLLKVYSGEVLRIADYRRHLVGTVKSRTVKPGTKTIQFPMFTGASAKYFVPGDNLVETGTYLNNIKGSDRVISLDRLLVAPILIDDLEEKLTHFDARQEYVHQLGESILNIREKQIFALILKGARSAGGLAAIDTDLGITSSMTASFGHVRCRGSLVYTGLTHALLTTTEFKEALWRMAAQFDKKDVPEKGRWAAVNPVLYWQLALDPGLSAYSMQNKDIANGANGSYENGPSEFLYWAGFKIIKSNLSPDSYPVTADLGVGATASGGSYYTVPGITSTGSADTTNMWTSAAGTDGANDYATHFAVKGLHALCWQEGAVCAAQWAGLTTEAEWQILYQANLIVTKQVVGQEVLHPEFCGAIVATTMTTSDGILGMSDNEQIFAKTTNLTAVPAF